MDELLTVADCAIVLSVTEHQVRKYINKGLLKAQKLGTDGRGGRSPHWRIWQKDLESFINQGR